MAGGPVQIVEYNVLFLFRLDRGSSNAPISGTNMMTTPDATHVGMPTRGSTALQRNIAKNAPTGKRLGMRKWYLR